MLPELQARLAQTAEQKATKAQLQAQLAALQTQQQAASAALAHQQEGLRQLTAALAEATEGPTGWLTTLVGGQAQVAQIRAGVEAQQAVVAEAEQQWATLAAQLADTTQQLAQRQNIEADYEALLTAQARTLETANHPVLPALHTLTTQIAQQQAHRQAIQAALILAQTVATAMQQVVILCLGAVELDMRHPLTSALVLRPTYQKATMASWQNVHLGLTLLTRAVAEVPDDALQMTLQELALTGALWAGHPSPHWETLDHLRAGLQQAQAAHTQMTQFMAVLEKHYQTTHATLTALQAQHARQIENA